MEITAGDVLFTFVGIFGAALIYQAVSNMCESVKDARQQRKGEKR